MEDLSYFQLFCAFLIWSIGSGIGSVVVAKYIYLPWVKELKDSEEEEYKIPYEELIPFKEIYNCDVDLDCISKERYITDSTPDGYVFIRYNIDEEGFEYWCDNKNVKFKYLETVARKYISKFLCKSIYKNRKADEEKECEKKDEEKECEKECEKKDEIKDKEEIEENDVFIKPKKLTKNNKNSKRTISNIISNKYIYKGNINELEIFKKKKETKKDVKKKMSFRDYKSLLLSSTTS